MRSGGIAELGLRFEIANFPLQMGRTCNVCENKDKTGGAFCAYCGERLVATVTCEHCGATAETDGSFCPDCGEPFTDSDPSGDATSDKSANVVELLEVQEVPEKVRALLDSATELLEEEERIVLAAGSDVGKWGQTSTFRAGLLAVTNQAVIYVPRSRKLKFTYRIPFEEIGSARRRGLANSYLTLWLPSTSIRGILKSIVTIEFIYVEPKHRAREMEQYIRSQLNSGEFPPVNDRVAKERAKPRGFMEGVTRSGLESSLARIGRLRERGEQTGNCSWDWAKEFNPILSEAKREFPEDGVLSDLDEATEIGDGESDLDYETAIAILDHTEALYSEALSRISRA